MSTTATAAPKRISWAQVWERLERAERALALGAEDSPERVRERLRERARALAGSAKSAEPKEAPRPVLTFSARGGRFAVDLHQVSEVVPLGALTAVPRAPAPVAGLMSRRDELLVVLDVARVLGLPGVGVADQTRVVVVGPKGGEAGLLAVSVDGITELTSARIAPPLEAAPFVEGLGDGQLVLLDAAAMLHGLGFQAGPSRGRPSSHSQPHHSAVERRKHP